MLRIALTIIQVFAALSIMGLVLLQRGKGADAGAGFGAGASGTVFGARGASTALSRATAIFAAVFMVNSLALAYMGTSAPTVQPKTLLDKAAEGAPAPAPATGAPATQLPAPEAAPPAAAPAPEGPAPQSGATAPAPSTPSPTPRQ
jgi:preprotein translocase subunit SecG